MKIDIEETKHTKTYRFEMNNIKYIKDVIWFKLDDGEWKYVFEDYEISNLENALLNNLRKEKFKRLINE